MVNIGFDLDRINSEFYTINRGSSIDIEENGKDGEARLKVIFQVSENKEFFRLLQETNSNWLAYSGNKKCADGVLIEIDTRDRSQCKLYIIELKRTIDSDKWSSKVKGQFRGATLRALAFLSSLGIRDISDVQYFTGYVNSEIERQIDAIKARRSISQASLIAKKSFVGIKDDETLEWENATIRVFEHRAIHQKICLQLDGNGVGVGTLNINNI